MADLADADFDHPLDPPEGWARDHVHEYVRSGGEKGHHWKPGVDTLLLTTVGRKSAKTRRTPLIYGKTDSSYAVVASKGGSDKTKILSAVIWLADIGDFAEVSVIEVLVKPGDTIAAEQSLVTVESDKASMEIPSTHAGVVKEMKVKVGDKVKFEADRVNGQFTVTKIEKAK